MSTEFLTQCRFKYMFWVCHVKLRCIQYTVQKNGSFFNSVFGYQCTSWKICCSNYRYTGCVSESGDFATLYFLVRRHSGGCRYRHFAANFNPLKPELNPMCCLLALLGAHHFLHVSRIRVKSLNIRLLMSYIYIYGTPILDVSRSHTTTQHSR